jgi:hypothetical protein
LQPVQSITETATWNGVANVGTWYGTNVWQEFDVSIPGAPAGSNLSFTINSPLTQSVTTDQTTYQSGASIGFTGTETNTSDQAVTFLNVNDVFALMGTESISMPAISGPSSGSVVSLQPGQSQTFTATWYTGAGDGTTPVSSGTYYVNFRDNFMGSDGASFVIDGPSSDPLPPSGASPTDPPLVIPSSPSPPAPPASSSSSPPQAPITPSAIQKPPVFTATLTTSVAP